MKAIKIKTVVSSLLLVIICAFGLNTVEAKSKPSGIAVEGAEIIIELKPNYTAVANVKTDEDGEFKFSFPRNTKIPKNGIFSCTKKKY